MAATSEFEQHIQRIDQLVGALEAAPDSAVRTSARELVQRIMELHGAGLERLLTVVHEAGAAGGSMIENLARDPLVSSLLLLYGLHPVDLPTRVQQALETSRPYLRSHGGNVELVSVDAAGTVRLRMEGSCHGCPSSALTLKLAIEQAIREAAPDVLAIEVEGETSQPPQPAPLPEHLVPLGYSGRNGTVNTGAGQRSGNGTGDVACTTADAVSPA